jgi:DNA-binding response OmpR family regulator
MREGAGRRLARTKDRAVEYAGGCEGALSRELPIAKLSAVPIPRARNACMNGRRNVQPGDALSFGPFSLFVAGRLLKRADEMIPLGGRALDVLIALTERAGEVVSYRELISIAWPNVTVDEANLRVQIATLRKALSDGEHERFVAILGPLCRLPFCAIDRPLLAVIKV